MNSNISVWGNLGKDPELKFNKDGKAFTSISIAVTPRFRNGDTYVDATTIWFKIAFFGQKAENVAGEFGKGMRVKVTGQMMIGQPWTDKGGIHHDGGYEIGNADVELAPWEAKAKTDTAPPTASGFTVVSAAPQLDVAPF